MNEKRLIPRQAPRGLGVARALLTLAPLLWLGCSRTLAQHMTPSTQTLHARQIQASPTPGTQESEQRVASNVDEQRGDVTEATPDPYDTVCGSQSADSARGREPIECVFHRGYEAYSAEDYQTAATALLSAVDAAPDHEEAAVALLTAAEALRRLGRLDSSRLLLQRIIDQIAPLSSTDPRHQASLDGVVASAYFDLGSCAADGTNYQEALGYYQPLADNRRFARSNDERAQRYRVDAMTNVALIFERLQRYPEAIRYYQRIVADGATSEDDRRHGTARLSILLP